MALSRDLVEGNRFVSWVNNRPAQTVDRVIVTILSTVDNSGQAMVRFWASRSDTRAEGWIYFDPSAVIHLLEDGDVL